MDPATGKATRNRRSRWSRLLSICASLPVTLSVQQLLDLVVRKTAEFFDAEGCVIFLATEGRLVPAAWVGFPARPPEVAAVSGRRLREHLDRFLAPARCRRFMSAAMVAGGTRTGELVVCSWTDERPPFGGDEREMLSLLAHRAALAVEDARILERARREREALARVAAALAGEVEVRRVAETAVQLAVAELGADGATIWMAHPEERVLELLAFTGYGPEVAQAVSRLSFDTPTLAALAATTQQIQVVERLEQLPDSAAMTRRVLEAAGMESVVAAPAVAKGRLMGVVAYARKVPHRWGPEERALVANLADLLASAVFNARLYQESERRRLLAEAVIENSPVGIAVMAGPEHRYVLVNAARERITFSPREAMLGRTYMEVSPGLAGGPVPEAIERVYRTGENAAIPEYSFDFGPPLGIRHLSLLYAPLRGPDGRVEGVISLMQDISEQVAARRKQEELTAELRAANERLVEANLRASSAAALAQQRAAELEAALANIADAVFVCDPQGRITLISRAGLEIIGAERPAELLTLADYVAAARVRHPDGQPVPPERLPISRALRGEVVRGVEEIVYDARAQRDRYVLASAAPVRDQEGRSLGAVEVQSDITHIREFDLLRDEFITVAAHEIKTPVTAIKGFAQALARTPDACQPRYHKALETIVQQSDRLDALLRDFLEVFRLRWGQVQLSLRRIDLTSLVSEVVSRTATTAARHRLLLSRQDAAWVLADRRRMEQVLVHLLDNAIKFSPQGGDIEVQVVRQEDRAVVSVADHGVGIPRDRQAHVFERFYRAHIGTPYDYGGLGVGLYISREIVRRHGGEMWFESEEGKGSTFYFSLPLAT